MKKVFLMTVAIVTILITSSCSNKKSSETNETTSTGETPTSTEPAISTSKGPEFWAKFAETNGLTNEDVKKAIDIGVKMQQCNAFHAKRVSNSLPDTTAMGSDRKSRMEQEGKYDDCIKPFIKEYEAYCIQKFGTAEYGIAGDFKNESEKKVHAFRQIMFDTRDEKK